MSYRADAKKAVERAKQEIESETEHRLRYAALELRMALEALIYERASLYKEELCHKKLSTWQPKKLLSILLDIDPSADKTRSISIKPAQEEGDFFSLGTERLLSLAEIKKYYDRLGSYLHTPTIDQLNNKKENSYSKLKDSCVNLIKILDEVLSSKICNSTFKRRVIFDCDKCGNKINRIIDESKGCFNANCIFCDASYTITTIENEQYRIEPIAHTINCANSSCRHEKRLWPSDIIDGMNWECAECHGKNILKNVWQIQYHSK